jgi:hypothetical protein
LPTGQALLALGDVHTWHIWQATTGDVAYTLPHADSIYMFDYRWAADGTRLLTRAAQTMYLWEIPTLE